MSRVVDFCPSSDDELPDLKNTVKKPIQQKPQPTPGRSLSPKKDLVPKSATKSVRKIRRLENTSQLKGNLLFQKAAPEEPRNRDFEGSILEGSPRKSPAKRRGREAEQSFMNDSIFDDSPPRTVKRTARKNRAAFIPILEDESENDSESTKIDQLLSVQTPALKRLKPLMRKTKKSKDDEDESPETPEIKSIDSSGIVSADTSHNTSQDLFQNNSQHISQDISHDEPQDSSQHVSQDISNNESQDNSQDAFDSQEAPDLTPDDQLMAESTTIHEDSTQEPSIEQVEAVEEAHADESGTDQTMSEGSSSFSNESSGSEFMSDQSMRSEDHASSPLAPKASIPRSLQVSKIPAETSNALQPRGTNSAATPSASAKATEEDTAFDLADELSRLQLQAEYADADQENQPSTPTKSAKPKGLASPSKRVLIPKTPHRPSTDAFWNQESVNDWNETHSPKKIILPPKKKSPVKAGPKKESRKAFDAVKQDIASDFLKKLDAQITEGKIAELAESTGGVQLIWSKTLNTTAGRANWRRETLRTKKADGTEVSVTYKHHSSIELAEKVIDDEERLLNVVAHEFCHLANFMVSGISNNPHGKEFKAWASKTTRAFADRGVKVTTKHTYEIAFKYVWECGECGSEYKRHSRSIDPQKHRCGSCKGTLKQTKPAPRGGGKPSEYQIFVREQMKVVKEENPGIPQKDIMKVIAGKWAKRSGKQGSPSAETSSSAEETSPAAEAVTEVAAQVVDLTL